MTAPRQIVVADKVVTLTPRQIDVARCAADGYDVAGSAVVLGMAEKRVKKHRSALMAKLGVLTMICACVRLVREGVL